MAKGGTWVADLQVHDLGLEVALKLEGQLRELKHTHLRRIHPWDATGRERAKAGSREHG